MLNVKQHFKLTSVYTFFAALTPILQIIVYPIIEGKDKLNATEFGYLAITEAIISFLTILIAFGSNWGMFRLYYDYDNNKDLNKFISTITSTLVVWFLFWLLISIIFAPFFGSLFQSDALKQFEKYGPYLVIIAFNRVIINNNNVLFRNQKNLLNFTITNLSSAILRAAFQIVGVLYFNLSFLGYVWGTALGSSIISLGLIAYSYKKYSFSYDLKIIKTIIFFSLPLILNEFLGWSTAFIDRFLLLKNPENLGIYDNAMKFAIGLQLIIQGFGSAVQPELYRYFKAGYNENINDIKKISNLFVFQSILLVTLAIIPINLFIDIFFETNLIESSKIISIVFVRYILFAQSYLFSWVIIYEKKTKIFFQINVLTFIISIVINILLIPLWGYKGSIFAFIAAYSIQVITLYKVQQKIRKINWNIKKVLIFPLSIILFASMLELITNIYELNHYIKSLLILIYVFVGLWQMYSNEIKTQLSKMRNTYLNK